MEGQTSPRLLQPFLQTMGRAITFNPIISPPNELSGVLSRLVLMILPSHIQLKVGRGTSGPLDRMVQHILDHMRVIVGRQLPVTIIRKRGCHLFQHGSVKFQTI